MAEIKLRDKIDEILHDEIPTNINRPEVVKMIIDGCMKALTQNIYNFSAHIYNNFFIRDIGELEIKEED